MLVFVLLLQVFVSNITQATQDAADIVLVIDESGTMSMEHEWLLVMIPLLESALIENGAHTLTYTIYSYSLQVIHALISYL